MTITVAGNKKEYEDGLKLTELIEKEDIESPEYVTVTINDEFISKADVPETEVKDGDVRHPVLNDRTNICQTNNKNQL